MSLVKVIPLGGVGEIGKNCTVIEQGDDLIVIDCGLSFPNEEMPGVEIVVPDFAYLLENREKVRGIFLTHAHEDHIGALPYALRDLDVPVFGSELTIAMVRSRLEEKLQHKKPDLRVFKIGEKIRVGTLSVEPIRITHSIPENCAISVGTEHGILLFTGDFKFDFTPVDGKLSNIGRLAQLGEEGVLCLFSDSTNVERPGWGPSERTVSDGLRNVLSQAQGRVLLTTFASNIHRMQQLMEVASETGRKVAVVGRRMEMNLDLCERMGYVRVPKGVRITLQEMPLFADHQLAILTTGSQGEPMSALVQMSKAEYGRMQIKPGDTLIYSARPIPGNEGAIWRTINRLFEQGCRVVYDAPSPIHVSGHAYQEELKMMINLTRPYYLAPVHGEPRHQHLYLEMARGMGYGENRLFTMRDGIPLVLDEKSAHFGERVAAGRVLVDSGSGTPGVPDEVLRDRYNISKDGVIVVTVAIDMTRGELAGEPILQAKGFHDPGGVLQATVDQLADVLRALSREEIKDTSRVRSDTWDVVKKSIQRRVQVRPLIVPTIVEV
jgi:ribonuclease J